MAKKPSGKVDQLRQLREAQFDKLNRPKPRGENKPDGKKKRNQPRPGE